MRKVLRLASWRSANADVRRARRAKTEKREALERETKKCCFTLCLPKRGDGCAMQRERKSRKHAHENRMEELGGGKKRPGSLSQARSRPSAISSTAFVDSSAAAEGGEEEEEVAAESSSPASTWSDSFAAACCCCWWWCCFFFDFCDLLPVRGGLEAVDVGCCCWGGAAKFQDRENGRERWCAECVEERRQGEREKRVSLIFSLLPWSWESEARGPNNVPPSWSQLPLPTQRHRQQLPKLAGLAPPSSCRCPSR